MPKQQINSMYPEHIYNYGSDVIEKLTSIGAKITKRTSSPARINDVILKLPKFWLDVTVTQGNDYRWNFDVSVSADSESYDDYNESKYVPIDTKRSVQFYVGQLTKLIKQMISKLKSKFGDTGQMNMFESKKSKLIESAITKIVRRVMNEGSSPKFSVGQLVVYKKASKPAKVLSVSNDSYEPTYKLKFVDNGKEVTEGESSLMAYNGLRYKNESKVNKRKSSIFPNKKITEAKSGLNLALPNCNLFVKGWGLDKNGNMRIIVGFPNDKGFPIQTNGTLPRTNMAIQKASEGSIRSELPTIGKEVLAYVQKYGPATVKNRLKVYGQ